MRSVRTTTAVLLGVATLLVPLAVSGCGGDGDGGGGSNEITITITNCDTTTYASQGVFCFDFTVTGPANASFDLQALFEGGPGQPPENAYPIPPGLLQFLNPPPNPTNPTNIQLGPNGQLTGRFCWYAGADLGFVAAQAIRFILRAVTVGTTDPLGPPAQNCGLFNYAGGGASIPGIGPPIGTLTGRAGHIGAHVGGKNIAIAGGEGLNSGVLNSYMTVDRFNIDLNTFTYTHPASLTMQSKRSDHACSFFLDQVTNAIKLLATGGYDTVAPPSANATADVYSFSPESIAPTANTMVVPRRGHTATWIPSNRVVIIGGEAGGPGAAYNSIEIYDPFTNGFSLLGVTLNFGRRGHTATLLPSGKILVAGGYDPAAPTTALQAELFDPATSTVMLVPVTTMNGTNIVDRTFHTATRLANGWVLVAGGYSITSSLTTISSTAQVFQPELGTMGAFTDALPCMSAPGFATMGSARAFHGATLLGNGNVLLTGGETSPTGPVVTTSAELFLASTMCFTPTIPLTFPRADHSSDPTDCGAIAITGGRTGAIGAPSYLNDLEIFPFTNTNPAITNAFTASAGSPGYIYLDITVTDQDGDGGYVIIRFRAPPGNNAVPFRLATIDQQSPSTGPSFFPNMQVGGMPSQSLPYAFRWHYAADGLSSGQSAEVEIIPVGVTLGTPVRFTVTQLP
jgi:hypothetical protein